MPEIASIEFKIGTSGFSFEDWKRNFYPDDIEKGKMLDYYVKFFNTVEINSTYYHIPHPAVMFNLVKKVPDSFEFIVKVPQSFTHQRIDFENDLKSFHEAINPMVETKQLKGLLAQFPYSFKYNQNNLEFVSIIKDALSPQQLYVEFRHDSWVNREMYDYFCSKHINYVCVDSPQLKGLLKPDFFTTTDTAYLRLHGRNKEKWWDGGELRYDYNYSKDEINEWIEKINKSKSKVNKMFLFFNNCHGAQAVKNAIELKKILTEKGALQ